MSNPLLARVSLFPDAYAKDPTSSPTLGEVLSDIQADTYAERIAELRTTLLSDGKPAYDKAKAHLPGFTPAAHLRTRDRDVPVANALVALTGVVHFDLDDLASITRARQEVTAWPCTVFCFLSPSAAGLKVGLAAEGILDEATYRQAWEQGKAMLASVGLTVDRAPKSLKSLCFVSADGFAFLNAAPIPFSVSAPAHVLPRQKRGVDSRPPDMARAASALQAIPNASCDYNTYCRIGMALHDGSPDWQDLWDDWASAWPAYNQRDQDKKWQSFHAGGGVTLGTLIALAKQCGWRDPLAQERPQAPHLSASGCNGTQPTHTIDPAEAWLDTLLKAKDGSLRPLLANIIQILCHDGRWRGALGFDQFAETVMLTAPPPYLAQKDRAAWQARPLLDTDDSETCAWIQRNYCCHTSTGVVAEALEVAARRSPFHAVRDYLSRLAWDGTSRLDTWLCTYAHAADTPFVRAVASKTLLSAIARVMEPGCQADTVLVLEGEQGERKSAFIRALAADRHWFSDDLPDLRDKDARQALRGIWILELGELETLSKSEVETIKRFISAPSDFYRPSYGRRAQQFPRQTIFIGSTNRETYLKDDTGNRRFWPVRIASCNTEALESARDQLWAEAVVRYHQGEAWWLEQAMEAVAREEQAARVEFDDWTVPVMEYAEGRNALLARDVLKQALMLEESQNTRANANRVGTILRLHGWRLMTVRENNMIVKRFVPPEKTL